MTRHHAAATVFPRLWGLWMAAGFASVAAQLPTTFGAAGLFPVAATAASVPWWSSPTLLAFVPHDTVFLFVLAVGFVASLTAAIGRGGLAAWGLLIGCWWQVSMASPMLLGLPPDFIMLHGALAAALMEQRATRRWGVWLAWGVFFFLYVEAGLVKATRGAHGAEWMSGEGMNTFFEIVPLPGLLAPTLHALPTGAHAAMTWAGLLGQILVPWLLFAGARGRLAAFAWFTAFQLILLSGANFGLLLWGSLTLGIALVDDVWWPAGMVQEARRTQLSASVGRRIFGLMVAAWMLAATIDFSGIGRESAPRRILEGWRLATFYGMFDSIPSRRIEWYFHASDPEGATGDRLQVPHQVTPGSRGGSLYGPHHPRLPFFLWFHASIQEAEDWTLVTNHFPGSTDRLTRPTAAARYVGAWLCRREQASHIVLDVHHVELGVEEDAAVWSSTSIARSQPVACDVLTREATTPYSGTQPRRDRPSGSR